MRIVKDENGQTLIFVALGLACILGFAGLATDVSVMLHDKRIVQTAADTAAVAAATEYLYVSTVTGDVQTAGQNATVADGITNGTNGTVTINDPPLYGPHAGAAGYIEAIVQRTDNRYLLGMVGGSTVQVSARAVAWTGAQNNACFYVLDGTASPGAHLQGSYTVGVPGCGMIVDSDASNALEITGNGGSLSAGYIGVVGKISGTLPDGQKAVSGALPVSDPLAGTLPAYSCTATACTEVFPNGTTSTGPSCTAAPAGNTWGLNPVGGAVCYNGTITIPSNVTLNPGTYIFTGNVSLGGNTGITADAGITFYFTTGSLTMVGTPNITITSPSSGPFAGIAYVEAPAITSFPSPGGTPGDTSIMYINGDSSGLFDGIVYVPDAEMEISGNTTITLPEVIVDTFYDKGNATINITNTLPEGVTPIKNVVLVE